MIEVTRTAFVEVRHGVATRFDAPEAKMLFAYWQSKSGGVDVPDWSDFDLRDLAEIQSNIMVKDVVGDGQEWINCYFGAKLCQILGVDAAGLKVGEYHSDDEADEIIAFYNHLADRRLPLRATGFAIVHSGVRLPYEGAYLPLTCGSARVESIVSVAVVPLADTAAP